MLKNNDMALITRSINDVLQDYVLINKNDVLYDILDNLSLETLGYYIKLKAIIIENDTSDGWYPMPKYDLNLYEDLMKELIEKKIIEYNSEERMIKFNI